MYFDKFGATHSPVPQHSCHGRAEREECRFRELTVPTVPTAQQLAPALKSHSNS